MNGGLKIGKLLCEEDIITKRQLNVALQAQVKGDKRTLGEILVDRGYCSLDDITDATAIGIPEFSSLVMPIASVILIVGYNNRLKRKCSQQH